MASFIGTFDEFTKYISPRARNVVNAITKNYKLQIGKCEHCGSTTETLEAAHVTGRERSIIIEEILKEFTNGEIITIDLEVFENKFLSVHEPINKIILVLCRPCHRKYDKPNNTTIYDEVAPEEEINSELISNAEITEYLRQSVPNMKDDEVLNLQSLEYCKPTFGLSFEVLKKIPLNSSIEEIRKLAQINGYNRWSTQRPIQRNNLLYLVTTQWYDKHRRPFMSWQEKFK